MSLFKYQIISNYNIDKYIDGALKLKCAKGAIVTAPFDGKLSNNILSKKNHRLHISGIDFENNKKVKAGDVIGIAKDGYILIFMENDDILKYLRGLDIDVNKKGYTESEIISDDVNI